VTARELVLAHGWNANAYQILNPGIAHWFNGNATAVVGYTRRSNVFVVAGAPVCAEAAIARTAAEFEEFAHGCVCYVGAQDRLREVLGPSHAAVALGAQPVWNPREWAEVTDSRSFRAQLNRSRNKGVRVEDVPPLAARDDPAFGKTLAAWLHSRGMPPMHFLVEPETLEGETEGRVVLSARRGEELVAYLVASPVNARNGYLIEQVARAPEAPNGTSELLIDAAMRKFASEGRTYATMGLVALASAAEAAMAVNPAWVRALMWVARNHANRFYNFRGLEKFRAKMNPQGWERVYAIANQRRFSPWTLYAMGGAFSGISPVRAIATAVAKAVRQELSKGGHGIDSPRR
jgi:phosphatidylglycerol lysyltransferase